jgi:hypothetical protein
LNARNKDINASNQRQYIANQVYNNTLGRLPGAKQRDNPVPVKLSTTNPTNLPTVIEENRKINLDNKKANEIAIKDCEKNATTNRNNERSNNANAALNAKNTNLNNTRPKLRTDYPTLSNSATLRTTRRTDPVVLRVDNRTDYRVTPHLATNLPTERTVLNAYKKGFMHAGSVIIGGAALGVAAAIGTGKPLTESDIGNYVAAGVGMIGTSMEGVDKFYRSTPNASDAWKVRSEKMASFGTILGGLSSGVAAAFSFWDGVKAFRTGDDTMGALHMTSGGVATLAMLAGIAEGIAGLKAARVATGFAGMAGAAFGVVGAFVGIGITAYGIATHLIEYEKTDDAQNKFFGMLGDLNSKYGIRGGPSTWADWTSQHDPIRDENMNGYT